MNRLKVVLLCVLVATSIILTANVWFDDISYTSLFDTKAEDAYTQLIDGEITFVTPSKLILFDDSSKEFYLIKRTRAEFDELNLTTRKLMQQVLLKGQHEVIEGINWRQIWSEDAINLDLGVKIKLREWIEDLHVTKKKNKHNEFEFDRVVIQILSTGCRAFLINEEENQVLSITAENKKMEQFSQRVLLRTGSLTDGQTLEKVESTQYNEITDFENNLYFQKEKNGVVNNPVFEVTPPFTQIDGSYDKAGLEELINPFFPNSAMKYMVEGDNSKNITYRDARLIVKYNIEDGIIEYSDISVGKGSALNLSSAYKSAIAFMEKDIFVANQEIHLSNYSVVDNEAYFYFEYTFDDYDIVIPFETKAELNITSPIEIVVSNGKVSFYKRLIFEYQISIGTFINVNQDYRYVVEELKEISESKTPINDAYIAYVYYRESKECEIIWVAESDKRYLIPLQE